MIKERFIHILCAHPKKSLFALLLFFLASIPGLFLIEDDFTYKIWHNDDDPLIHTFNDFQNDFGNDDKAVIAIESKKGIFTNETLAIIKGLTKDFWKLSEVGRVESLANAYTMKNTDDELASHPLLSEKASYSIEELQKIKEEATSNKLISGILIDKNAQMTQIILTAKTDLSKKPDYYTLTKKINEIVEKHKKEHLTITFVGNIPFTHIFKTITIEDIIFLMPLAIIAFVVIIVFLYRNLWCLITPFLIIGISILAMLGISGYLGHKQSLISSAIPVILLSICMADAIHLLTTYVKELKKGTENTKALRFALAKNLNPTLLTTITTAIGFISFTLSKITPVKTLGIDVAIGVCIAWITSYILIASFGLLFPPNIKAEQKQQKLYSFSFIAQVVARYKTAIFIPSIFIIVAAVHYSSQLEVNMDPRKQFSPEHSLNLSINKIEKYFGTTETIELVINSNKIDGISNPHFLKQVDKLNSWLLDLDYVVSTQSILDIIKELYSTFHNDPTKKIVPKTKEEISELLFMYSLMTPEELNSNNLISFQQDKIRLSVRWKLFASKLVLKNIKKIEDKAKEMGLDVIVTGKASIFHYLTPYVVETFLKSFSIAIIAITLLMIIILKSFRLGLLSLIPNVFPLCVGGSIIYFAGFQFDIGIAIIASVSLGLAVDDSIHFLIDFKKYRDEGLYTEAAISKVFDGTVPALCFTTLIIATGFATFSLAQYIPNSRFGYMTATIIMIALIADIILLPACLNILYKKRS